MMLNDKEITIVKMIAQQHGVSVYEAAKMKTNYRTGTASKKCQFCKHKTVIHYRSGAALQCEVIGICGNEDANILETDVCDKYER